MTFRDFVVIAVLHLTLLIAWVPMVYAADKNGVSPNTISLPSGPGSIEGLGESFQPMLNTGTARYEINISVPSGTANHTPQLSLRYDSGQGDGTASIGWRYAPGSISRRTDKGIPRYIDAANNLDDDHDNNIDEADELDLFVGPDGEELVPFADNIYRARIEGNFARYRKVGLGWEVELKSGTTLYYGNKPDSRVSNNTETQIFRWLLEKSIDTNGNVIEYFYSSYPGSTNQKYLKEIRYGPGAPPWNVFYFASFNYQEKPDWRKDYRSGFLVKTSKRLKSIDIGIQGVQPDQCAPGDWNGDQNLDALIKRYTLEYNDTSSHISHLRKITLFGSDGVNYLPPISFNYSAYNLPSIVSAEQAIIDSENTPNTVMDNEQVDLIDLNRDSLPDILKTDRYGGKHTVYRNLGVVLRGGKRVTEWSDPAEVTSEDDLAWLLHLDKDQVSLADMNGDGNSDLVQTSLSQQVYYFPNKGNMSWGAKQAMSINGTVPPAPFAFENVKSTDLDFNKQMDIVKSTENGYSVWYNYRNGSYSQEVRTAGARSHNRVIQFSDTGFDFADLNGDRLNDAARIRSTYVTYSANMGQGHFAEAVEITIPDIVLTDDGEDSQISRAKLTDINGDGLTDLVLERAQANQLWFWLNLGTDTFSPRVIITDMPSQYGINTVVRWADLNGNGSTDLIYADSFAEQKIRMLDIGELIGGSAHLDLLTEIDNGLGVITHIQYQSSTEQYLSAEQTQQPWNSTLPFPVSLVTQVTTTTGLDLDQEPGLDEYRKDYSYRDGFYEDLERQFRGFNRVSVTELGDETAPTLVTQHEFFTGGADGIDNDNDGVTDEILSVFYREEDALKGLLRSQESRSESGTLFNRIENTWSVRNLLVNPQGTEVRYADKTQSDQIIFEGTDTPETMRTTYAYDDYGNMTEAKSFGALSIAGDEVFTFVEYINDTNNWLIGFPKRTYLTDVNLTKASESFSYYDGTDYTGLPLGQIAKGNLTRQQSWVSDTRYVDSSRSAYDSYGNIIARRNANGFNRSIEYDTLLNTFPIQEQIEVGNANPDLTVAVTHNLGLGVITSSLDFNGNQTDYLYDVFARTSATIQPGDSIAFPTKSFNYKVADPNNNLLYQYDSAGVLTLTNDPVTVSSVKISSREVSGQNGSVDTIQYVDGLGRELALVEETETGFAVTQAVLFNKRGTPYLSYVPYAAANSDYSRPLASIDVYQSQYDAMSRSVLNINPENALGELTSSAIQFLPLKTTTTDENGNTKAQTADGQGRLLEVHEFNQNDTYITRYAYDQQDNLITITDSQNNVKSMLYDGLSRKIKLNDIDRGQMLYQYDDVGNLLQTTDNKQQIINYAYDGANRLLSEDYQDSVAISPDVAYYYDTASSDYPNNSNTKGKLSWVEDLSGASFWSYDARGNSVRAIKRIENEAAVQDYHSSFEYDAMNRPVTTNYPDGDKIEYLYDKRSQLKQIPGLVDSIIYHPSSQMEQIIYANGRASQYDYDEQNRLIHLVTDVKIPSGNPIQDIAYEFDGASNILSIVDGRTQLPAPAANANQSFQYDDLYRLTQASGAGYGLINYQYDRIGNMIFKGSPAAADANHINDPLINLGVMNSGGSTGSNGRLTKGNQPGPHAITSTASGLLYDYDDNGNMTSHATGELYEWDFKDRLIKTTTATTTADYVYDYSGQRVIKKSQTGATSRVDYYIGEGFELRDGKPVKFVFANGQRIARVEGRLAKTGQLTTQELNFKPGWNFFSLQIEPTVAAVSTVLAPLDGNYTEVWAFDSITQQYQGFIPSGSANDLSEIHAQRGYIINVANAATLQVNGIRQTNPINLVPGFNLISSPADAPVAVQDALNALANNYQGIWDYTTEQQIWRGHLPNKPAFLSELDNLQSDKAYWLKMQGTGQLLFQSQNKKILFYHADHLGSANVVTDFVGDVVESTEFYPFGQPRHEHKNTFDLAYKYTGKELDNETGLMYYEARYMDAVTGRFVSVDPLAVTPPSAALLNPQLIHPYSYTANNPIAYLDPDGLQRKPLPPVVRRGGVFDKRPVEQRNIYDPKTAKLAVRGANAKYPFFVYGIARLKGDGDAVKSAKLAEPAIRAAIDYVNEENPRAAVAATVASAAGVASDVAGALGTVQNLSGFAVMSGTVTNAVAASLKSAEAASFGVAAALTPTRPNSPHGRTNNVRKNRILKAERAAQQVLPILSQAPGAGFVAGEKFDSNRRGSIDRANIGLANAAISASNARLEN